MKNGYFEYGEVARKPISQKVLIRHWIKINDAMTVKGSCWIYCKGRFVIPQMYHVKQIDTNEYISKIKFVAIL